MRFVAAVGGCFEPSFAIVKDVCVCVLKEVCLSSSRIDSESSSLCFLNLLITRSRTVSHYPCCRGYRVPQGAEKEPSLFFVYEAMG